MNAFDGIVNGQQACLVEAALDLATDEFPELNPALYLETIRQLSEKFVSTIAEGPSELLAQLDCLNDFFFGELGFHGDLLNYYDPRNSYLNCVIDSRRGIPITLAVLYQAFAAAIDIPLHGINLPGHFMLGVCHGNHSRTLIDVFHQGKRLTWQDCLRSFPGIPIIDCTHSMRVFPPMSDRDILRRMLHNLRSIYSKCDPIRCELVQSRLLQLCPNDPAEIELLAGISLQNGKPRQASTLFKQLLENHPEMKNVERVKEGYRYAMRESSLLN